MEEVRHESVDRPEFPFDLDAGCGSTAIATSIDNEVAELRALVQRQKEDLETAALIGQRLLDSAEELSAKLEAAREEKWLASCEKDALRRYLEHATQRWEQMQEDTTVGATQGEPQVEGDLWSPASGAGIGAGPSLPEGRQSSYMGNNTSSTATRDTKRDQRLEEVARLRWAIESLEQANAALKEELVEARLEATALRRTSIEHRQGVWDQGRKESVGGGQQQWQLRADWRAPYGGEEEDAGNRRSLSFSSSLYHQEETEIYEDVEGPPAEEGKEEQIDQESVEGAPVGSRQQGPPYGASDSSGGDDRERQCAESGAPAGSQQEGPPHRASDSSGGDDRKRQCAESASTSVSSLRRLSSSAFEDEEEEKAELIQAVRGQIAQLQLEVKTTAAAGTGIRSSETSSSCEHQRFIGLHRSWSKCSSDEDRGGGRGSCTREKGPIDQGGKSFEKCGGSDGDGGRVDDDTTKLFLRARVSELLVELESTQSAFEELQQRARQDQATIVELQKELLGLHSTRGNNSGEAAVAGISGGTVRCAGSTATDRDLGSARGSSGCDGGGGGGRGEGLEHRNHFLWFHGLGWLSWLWRIVFCR